jgi:hypothetical protein
MRRSNLSWTQAAAAVPCSVTTLRKWFRIPGRKLTYRLLGKVAAFVGLSPEEALNETGGITGEYRRAHAVRPKSRRRRTGAAIRKTAAALRGRTRPRTVAEKVRASWAANTSARAAASERLRQYNRTTEGATMRRLLNLLRWQPNPSENRIREHAVVVAAERGCSPTAVLHIWAKPLRKHSLWAPSPRGRRPDETVHRFVLHLDATWPHVGKSGRRQAGFYEAAAAAWNAQHPEPKRHFDDGEALHHWVKDHLPACILQESELHP